VGNALKRVIQKLSEHVSQTGNAHKFSPLIRSITWPKVISKVGRIPT